ncbi:hypothetical protein ANN_08170 [Periplaneta americana]|uniref:Uncharacterized protein n=1 Tax=Periplaneta americana TaxID=6978 RepID=A0ABQ8T0Q0_PERAM|nr:hypothetical protein ANN_08170 [Periplaneta americana]
MWIWRRMERVKWRDRIRNEAVLERVDEERMMLKLIRKRKRNWLGHWLRRNCLLKDALERMVNGRRVRGRRRYQMIDDIKLYESYEETKGKAENRKDCRKAGFAVKDLPLGRTVNEMMSIVLRTLSPTPVDNAKALCVYKLKKYKSLGMNEISGGLIQESGNALSSEYSSPNIIRNIKSRRLKCAGHVARMGESRNAYRVLVERPEGKRPLGMPRCTWEDNIKMGLREVGYVPKDWINLAQDWDRCTVGRIAILAGTKSNIDQFLSNC